MEAKEKILVMTPEERIKLGINKSTLWYQKQNLAAGKRIKLYSKSPFKTRPMNTEHLVTLEKNRVPIDLGKQDHFL